MGLGETGNLMGESQAFPWEGGASRSELNEMIACGNHTLKRDGAEQSEADEADTSSNVLTVFSPPAPTSSGLRATFPSQGKAWGFRFQGIRSTFISA